MNLGLREKSGTWNDMLLGVFAPLVIVAALSIGWASNTRAGAIFDSVFRSSSTGTSTIAIGDTISFDSFVTIDPGPQVALIWLLLTGDIVEALATTTPCPSSESSCFQTTSSLVTAWDFAFDPGGRDEESIGISRTAGAEEPSWTHDPNGDKLSLGNAVYFALSVYFPRLDGTFYEGSEIRSRIGTFTITANAAGNFDAGPLIYPGVSDVYDWDTNELTTAVVPGNYTVLTPEPSTGLLVALGLTGLAARQRRSGNALDLPHPR